MDAAAPTNLGREYVIFAMRRSSALRPVIARRRTRRPKSYVRFRRLDDLPLDLVARTIAAVEVPSFVERVEEARSGARSRRAAAR
ncbi:MAG: hypothetical protein O3C25_03125 [Chloroflexi bacterium]|nr:hypothetical protein [Chloroflexota bacterium]